MLRGNPSRPLNLQTTKVKAFGCRVKNKKTLHISTKHFVLSAFQLLMPFGISDNQSLLIVVNGFNKDPMISISTGTTGERKVMPTKFTGTKAHLLGCYFSSFPRVCLHRSSVSKMEPETSRQESTAVVCRHKITGGGEYALGNIIHLFGLIYEYFASRFWPQLFKTRQIFDEFVIYYSSVVIAIYMFFFSLSKNQNRRLTV